MEHSAARLLEQHFSLDCDGPHAVMLTGGQTPLGIYRTIEESPPPINDSLRLLITDERHVPLKSPESNFGQMRAMVHALGMDESRMMRVHTELSLDAAADRYHEKLASFIRDKGRITLGLAGLGTDGHVASLFHMDDLQHGHGRYAIAVPRDSGPDRVSVTQDLLTRVEHLVFLVAGPEKADMVAQILSGPENLVAGQAVKYAGSVELWSS